MAVLSDDYPGSFTQSSEPLKNTTKSTEHNNCKRYKEKHFCFHDSVDN